MTATYLPAPIKVENNHINREPDLFLWAGCSIALGILSYYAPKTFLATSVGIFAYQVYSFNQLVQTFDKSKHQHIHEWAMKACMVMWSVGCVFIIKSLPCFWSAVTDLRHLHLIHAVGHLAKGLLMAGIVGGSLMSFSTSGKDLASRGRWVEMEDYVTNYPVEVKQEILSSYRKQMGFYISALLSQSGLATLLSRTHFAFSQFQPEENKLSILKNHFTNITTLGSHWILAIHQFQQLSLENQLTFAPILAAKASNFLEEERNQFPNDVKAVILNETLKGFQRISSDQADNYRQWQDFVTAFEKLPREQQSILGQELFRLIQTKQQHVIHVFFSETMRLAALKAWDRVSNNDKLETLAKSIFDGLSEPFQKEFGLFLQELIKNGTLEIDKLPRQMRAALPDNF